MSLTRIVRIRPGIQRNREQNVATSFAFLPQAESKKLEAERLFTKHYEACRSRWQSYANQGVLVFGFDDQASPIGELWLEADSPGARAGLIGRHSECDLIIPASHISVSLRHLVVLVRRLSSGATQIQVIDLATGQGFCDESGATHHSVTSEGPMFLKIGTVSLFLMMTPTLFSDTDTAKEAYHRLPERVFFDEREFHASGHVRQVHYEMESASSHSEQTRIRSKTGPVFGVNELCIKEETPVSALSFRSGRKRVVRSVGLAALEQGILIGRYSRCDLGPRADLEDSQISRVHLLLIQAGEDVLAIDTASTNGTRINGENKKFRVMQENDELDLGDGLRLLWNAAN